MIHCPVHSHDNRFFRQQNHFLGVNPMRFLHRQTSGGSAGGAIWWGEATDELALSERLETILWLKRSRWLRPRTGALRGGLSQPATTGNFGIRDQFSVNHEMLKLIYFVRY